MEIRKENLKCILTEEELREVGRRMARSVQEKKEAEDALKNVKKQYEQVITGADAQINLCASKIQSGYEFREVECEVLRNYESGIIFVVRCDTGEQESSRPMTKEERQMRLEDAQ